MPKYIQLKLRDLTVLGIVDYVVNTIIAMKIELQEKENTEEKDCDANIVA